MSGRSKIHSGRDRQRRGNDDRPVRKQNWHRPRARLAREMRSVRQSNRSRPADERVQALRRRQNMDRGEGRLSCFLRAAAGKKRTGIPNPVTPIRPANILPTEKKGAHEAPVGDCPPGRVRNAAGTRCVVDADGDDAFRGGSSGGGRTGGAAGGSRSGGSSPAPVFRSPIVGGKP